jgi:hypothetical protein
MAILLSWQTGCGVIIPGPLDMKLPPREVRFKLLPGRLQG